KYPDRELFSYKKVGGGAFLQGVANYTGTGSGPAVLNYDGHAGNDYPVPGGTPVVAAAAGVVKEVSKTGLVPGTTKSLPNGKFIRISHSDAGYETVYLHLTQVDIDVGDAVEEGKQIGTSG